MRVMEKGKDFEEMSLISWKADWAFDLTFILVTTLSM